MRATLPLLLALVTACDADPMPAGADAPPSVEVDAAHQLRAGDETEGAPSWEIDRTLADGTVLRQSERGVFLDGERVAEEPIGPVVIDDAGRRFVVAERLNGGPEARLIACAPPAPCHALVASGQPDRAALSPDGRTVAWVDAADGLPAIFVGDFDGGAPTQLTNVDLPPPNGGPPQGFVPPPHVEPLRFAGDRLTWTAPDGEHHLELP